MSRTRPVPGSRHVAAAFGVSALMITLWLAWPAGAGPMHASVDVRIEAPSPPGGEPARSEDTVQRAETRPTRSPVAQQNHYRRVAGFGVPLLLLTGLPMLVRSRRAAVMARGASATVLSLASVVLAPAMIGLFSAPVAGLMVAATRSATDSHG